MTMLKINLQFFGGRGGGGGKGGGGASGGNTVQTLSGTYTKGESVTVKESDTRYTVQGTNERIYKSIGSTIDTGKTVVNADGSKTYTYIKQGNKGNTYIVQETYMTGPKKFGSVSDMYKTKTTITKAKKKK
jgi:hypothetical protein